jgi:hypothetical protein
MSNIEPLSKEEQQILQSMIEYWQDHANRCDNINNRRMADWQKIQDLARANLLLKLQEFCK